MGKPTPSYHNNVIGVCIAKTACTPTGNKLDLVARSGQYSIFQAVKDIYNPCIRDEISSRDGITEVHLNKALQKAGFTRVRDRRAHAIKRKADPTGAGMYLFNNMRWRDPTDKEDRLELIAGWNSIVERFPKISGHCSLGRFLEVIGHFHKKWLPNAERMMRHDLEVEIEDDSHSEEDRSLSEHAPNEDTPIPGKIGAPMLPFSILPSLLNQEILRLQLELATTHTLALLQNRCEIPIPSMNPLPSCILSPPDNNTSTIITDTKSFTSSPARSLPSALPTFPFAAGAGKPAASNHRLTLPVSELLAPTTEITLPGLTLEDLNSRTVNLRKLEIGSVV